MLLLYTIIAAICVINPVRLEETTTPTQPNKKPLPASSGDGAEDGFDVYLPTLDWSDTFDWQLLKAVSSEEPRNVLISPLSIKLALVMLYEGSAGSTEKQFQSVMQFPAQKSELRDKYTSILKPLQNKKEEFTLNIGTKMFLESSISPNQQYAATIKSAYDTDIEATNFTNPVEASQSVNSWVEKLTNGRVKKLVSPDELAEDVLLLVGNAVYFKGKWRHEFPKRNSHEGGFYVSPTEVITVPYMSNTDKYYYAESKELDAKLLRLPYKGNQFSMFIVLPNSKGGLPELLKNINLATLKRQLYLMDKRTVDIVIPKFRFDFASSYTKILQDFGLNIIFSNTASFPGIARGVGSGTKWLFVNDIKQKAGIDVNEEGTEAVAVTEIQLGNKFGDADLNFNATHPFLIFIEDQTTGSILFAGKVENPLQSDTESLPSRFGGNQEGNVPKIPVDNEAKPNPVTSAPVHQGTTGQQVNFNPSPIAPAPDTTISSRFNYFDLELLQAFDDAQNYFISPASIKATLGMVLEGARGTCAEEISRVLRIPLDPTATRNKLQSLLYDLSAKSGTTQIESANGAFVSNAYNIVPEYKRNLQEFYKADVRSLNFSNNDAASREINNWVRDATRGLIPEIVNPENFNAEATLVIANALFFKGLWKIPFDERSTALRCFRNRKTSCRHVKMMQTTDVFNYKFIGDLDAQALELPYGDGKYAMLILVPSEKHSVEGLIRDLQHSTFASIINRLEPTEIDLYLPQFEIDYTGDIVPTLQALGIEQIFGQQANLSGIIERGQVKVSNIVHKAKVQVNEKGTTAAAATGVMVVPLMGTSRPRLTADHPFLFFIYHVESKNILFEGRLNDLPEEYDNIFNKPSTHPPVRTAAPQNQQSRQGHQPENRQTFSAQYQPVPSFSAPLAQNQQVFYPTETKTGTGSARNIQ